MFFFTLIISLFICTFFYLFLKTYSRNRPLFKLPDIKFLQSVHNQTTIKPLYIYFTLCDYFNPFNGNVSQEIAEHRVVTWCKEFYRFSKMHCDSNGRNPVHTFFYSEEDYNPQLLDILNRLHKDNLADVEIMLPFDLISPENFKRKIEEFRDVLYHHHGYLRKDSSGKICYGFTQGYNSTNRRAIIDSSAKHKLELILHETGCFADFSSYKCKTSYFSNSYLKLATNKTDETLSDDILPDKGLLSINSPYIYHWKKRRMGIFPSLEDGELSSKKTFFASRIHLWLKHCMIFDQIPNHLFIKLYTFGGSDSTIRYLLGENGLDQLWTYLEKVSQYNKFVLTYCSAWDMYSKIDKMLLKAPTNRSEQALN